jgi:hypothetical protein
MRAGCFEVDWLSIGKMNLVHVSPDFGMTGLHSETSLCLSKGPPWLALNDVCVSTHS